MPSFVRRQCRRLELYRIVLSEQHNHTICKDDNITSLPLHTCPRPDPGRQGAVLAPRDCKRLLGLQGLVAAGNASVARTTLQSDRFAHLPIFVVDGTLGRRVSKPRRPIRFDSNRGGEDGRHCTDAFLSLQSERNLKRMAACGTRRIIIYDGICNL